MVHSCSARTTLVRHITGPVKSAVYCVTKGNCHQQASKAILECNTALKGSCAVAVEEPPWKRSRRQGLEKVIAVLVQPPE